MQQHRQQNRGNNRKGDQRYGYQICYPGGQADAVEKENLNWQ